MSRELDNLDMDSRRALELGYGVHYGRYKADHPHTRDVRQEAEEDTVPMIECLYCGELFPATKRGKRFCSDKCRHDYSKTVNKGKTIDRSRMRQKRCAICGAEILDLKMRKYCSIDCAEKGRRIANKKWWDRQRGRGDEG